MRRYDWFTVTTEAGSITFHEKTYDGNDRACDAAIKAASILRAAGIAATVESTIWGWTEAIHLSRPVYVPNRAA